MRGPAVHRPAFANIQPEEKIAIVDSDRESRQKWYNLARIKVGNFILGRYKQNPNRMETFHGLPMITNRRLVVAPARIVEE